MPVLAVALAAESAPSAAGASALGFDLPALLFQIINFAVLLGLLSYLAYRPLLRTLAARRQTIEESLATAAAIERTRDQLEREQRSILAAARRQADEIIQRSEEEAARLHQQIEAAARKTAEQIVAQAQAQITRQLQAARAKLKSDTLQLVAAATGRVLGEKIDARQDQTLIQAALTEAEQALRERPRL